MPRLALPRRREEDSFSWALTRHRSQFPQVTGLEVSHSVHIVSDSAGYQLRDLFHRESAEHKAEFRFAVPPWSTSKGRLPLDDSSVLGQDRVIGYGLRGWALRLLQSHAPPPSSPRVWLDKGRVVDRLISGSPAR